MKIIKMAFLVLGIYILCTLPFLIFTTLIASGVVDEDEYVQYSCIVEAIWCINCFMNPLIYAWNKKELRSAFKGTLNIKRVCQTSVEDGSFIRE